jgi:hypothetical protein
LIGCCALLGAPFAQRSRARSSGWP